MFYKNGLVMALLMLLFSSVFAQELPFIVSPTAGTTLPTAIIAGQSTFAYYTVTNNTPITQPITNNFVKYFPPNVTQEFHDPDYTDICQYYFTLQPKGNPGDSCTLKLKVWGPVETHCSYDNPHECLFVCMSDKTSCAGTSHPLKVSFVDAVAVGYSINAAGDFSPLSYTSPDKGINWHLSQTPLLPSPSQNQGVINAVDCANAICTMVGYSFDDAYNYLPLAYTSHTAGQSWNLSSPLPLPTTPTDYTRGVLNQLSCETTTCATVGNFYYKDFEVGVPLGYTSSDNGEIFSLSASFPPATGPDQTTQWGMSCVGNKCVSVGQTNDAYHTDGFPIAYKSNDGGLNWSESSSLTLPSGGPAQGLLFSTDCSGTNCVAVGLAYDTSFLIKYFEDPTFLVYNSTDSGNNWTLSSPSSLPSNGKDYGLFWGVTCSGNTCVAVGQAYDDYQTDSVPVAYTSTDNGQTWLLSSGLHLPHGQTQGIFYTVSCADANCVAVGTSYNAWSSSKLPLVYTSTNSGKNWTLSPSLALPSGEAGGVLIGVSIY